MLITLAGLSALGYIVILTLQLRVFESINGYFWHFMIIHEAALGDWWLFPAVALLAIPVMTLVLRYPHRPVLCLALLILFGYAVQMGFGYMHGHGINGIRMRMIKTGHTEFARVAATESDVQMIASDYESFCMSDTSLEYVHTKPPGHLLFYMLTQKVSNVIAPRQLPGERLVRLATFASYVYPLLTYLAIIPIYLLGKILHGSKQALIACAFYVVIPSVTLVTLHLDQVLYPTLFMWALYLSARGTQQGSLGISAGAGALMYVSIYVSFSLLPVVPMCLAIILVTFYAGDKPRLAHGAWMRAVAGSAAGIVVLLLVGMWLFDYSPVTRFSQAMDFHRVWKHWQPDLGSTLGFAGLNLFEFAWWTGLPLVVIFVMSVMRSISGIRVRDRAAQSLFALAATGLLLLLAVLGQTKGEVGRLWIFVMPLICIAAGGELAATMRNKIRAAFCYIVGLQLVIVFLIKKYQDFW